jgi:nucleoid-associated protein YgaU
MKTNHSPYPQSRPTRALPGVVHAVALGLAVFSGGLMLSADLQAQSRTLATGSGLQLAADAPDSYTVKRGDTLWDIAKTFLNQPWYWPELWYLNPQVQNPHLIYPVMC